MNENIRKNKEEAVDILLSTYNGALFIKDLIDSILCQTYSNWTLLIRDDGSDDETLDIVHEYKRLYPDRFVIIKGCKKNLGPSQSFGALIESSSAPFVALCDQDDVWLPEKLEQQMQIMLDRTDRFGSSVPLLVHSDLQVCDETLNSLLDSLWRYQNIDPLKMTDIRCLLFQNCVTGCTILMNRRLADTAAPIPESAIMFDWWIALLAQQQGHIITMSAPLVKYRQHDRNTVGAKKWGLITNLIRFFDQKQPWRRTLHATRYQAQALKERLHSENAKVSNTISDYILLFEKKWYLRKMYYLKIGMKKYGRVRQLITWLLI